MPDYRLEMTMAVIFLAAAQRPSSFPHTTVRRQDMSASQMSWFPVGD